MGEEQGMRPSAGQISRVSPKQTGVHQPFADDGSCQVMYVAESPARHTCVDRRRFCAQHGVIDLTLDRTELTVDRVGTGDVGCVPTRFLRPRVQQHQSVRLEGVGISAAVQNLAAHRDTRRKRRLTLVSHQHRHKRRRDISLSQAHLGGAHRRPMRLNAYRRSATHSGKLVLILDQPHVDDGQ